MTPLLRKEVRDQRPFVILGLVLAGFDLLDGLFRLSPQQLTLAHTFEKKFSASGELSMFTFIIAFALGSGLLVREQDDRTIEFLDGLPVDRPRIFAAKVVVALAITLIYPVSITLYLFAAHALVATSLDPRPHLELLGLGLGLRLVQALCVLALGLALSHFRRLCWLLLGVLFSCYFAARERYPGLSILDPFALLVPHFEGIHWRVPWRALGVQLAGAGALLGVSLALFAGAGERVLRALEARSRGAVLGALISIATVGACAYAINQVIGADREEPSTPSKPASGMVFAPPVPAHTQTDRYRFTYSSNQSRQAERLAERADAAHEQVRELLGVGAGEPIAVDLTGSARHTLGTAYWSTLRMELVADEAGDASLATFAHETTHVLAMRLVGQDAANAFADFATFGEGLATYVETRFFHPEEPRSAHEVIAAALWARREVKLEELMDTSLLRRRRDAGLVYPLGLLWVDALVKRYGDRAPGRLLKAIGRKDAPENLAPAVRWQDSFQAARFDLSAVADDFYAELERLSRAHAAEIAALPRPRGAVEPGKEEIVVRPLLDTPAPKGWTVVCRFRVFEESAKEQIDGPYEAERGCARPRSRIAGGRLWFQLGLQSPYGRTLYEPWVSAPVE